MDCSSKSYSDLPKRTIKNICNIIILFKQTLKGGKNFYGDIAGFDMIYNEFKLLCREARKMKVIMIFVLKDLLGKKTVDNVFVMKVDQRHI